MNLASSKKHPLFSSKLTTLYGQQFLNQPPALEDGSFILIKNAVFSALGIPFKILATANYLNEKNVEITIALDRGYQTLPEEYEVLGTVNNLIHKNRENFDLIHKALLKISPNQHGAFKELRSSYLPIHLITALALFERDERVSLPKSERAMLAAKNTQKLFNRPAFETIVLL